ncbi:MAG: glycosyltransferase family 39 protein [Burkholderiales bacterium]
MPSDIRRLAWAMATVAFVAIWFAGLESRKIIKTDEGRYSELAREMSATGDWLTPRLNGIKYFEKPPLQYWATAVAFRAFGVHNWTARLWTALTGLLGVVIVWFSGRRIFGEPAGIYAALVAASSPLYFGAGHVASLDMGLGFFMTGALAGFLFAQTAHTERAVSGWMALAWLAAALAVLSKGLVAIVLPGAAIFVYSVLTRDLTVWRRLRPGLALLILALVAAPWFIAVSIVNPEFPAFFFIHEHFARFLTTVHRRVEPWWYFIPLLIGGLLPWTVPAVAAAIRLWQREAGASAFQPARFLLVYCAVIFVFFSASGSKLPAYILPLFPAAAILVGAYLVQVNPRIFALQMIPAALLAVAMIALSPLIAQRHRGREVPVELYDQFARWLQGGGLVLLGSLALGWFFCARGRIGAAVGSVAAGMLLSLQLAALGHDNLNPVSSAFQIASRVKPMLAPGTPFFSVQMYEQTLPFYLGRTVTLVDYLDEFEYGLKQEPALAVSDMGQFDRVWREAPTAFAVMNRETYETLRLRGLPMQPVASDPRRVIVRNQ